VSYTFMAKLILEFPVGGNANYVVYLT